jgi:hypothetical protein
MPELATTQSPALEFFFKIELFSSTRQRKTLRRATLPPGEQR